MSYIFIASSTFYIASIYVAIYANFSLSYAIFSYLAACAFSSALAVAIFMSEKWSWW